MGHRLSKIVTRTGDAGTTGLGDGSRVTKDTPRIDAIGAVDELNSNLGLLLAEELPPAVANCLTDVQHDLFDLGGELSIPGYNAVSDAHVERLESAVERFNVDLKPLKEFILPGLWVTNLEQSLLIILHSALICSFPVTLLSLRKDQIIDWTVWQHAPHPAAPRAVQVRSPELPQIPSLPAWGGSAPEASRPTVRGAAAAR